MWGSGPEGHETALLRQGPALPATRLILCPGPEAHRGQMPVGHVFAVSKYVFLLSGLLLLLPLEEEAQHGLGELGVAAEFCRRVLGHVLPGVLFH